MTPVDLILCFALLSLKHFIVDFPAQTPYQCLNKGIFLHHGGLLHASLHGIGTCIALVMFAPASIVVVCGLIDALIHYSIDWIKVNLNKRWSLTPQSEKFWRLLGADQAAHYLTYCGMLFLVV